VFEGVYNFPNSWSKKWKNNKIKNIL
jgi:hypothetical protein